MKKAIWLSYDWSVKGDYEGLYAWLDNLEAKECGDSLAFFYFEVNEGENIEEKIKEELTKNVSLTPKDRIYIIYRDNVTRKIKGKFIFGKRKAAPWTGYGSKYVVEDEEL